MSYNVLKMAVMGLFNKKDLAPILLRGEQIKGISPDVFWGVFALTAFELSKRSELAVLTANTSAYFGFHFQTGFNINVDDFNMSIGEVAKADILKYTPFPDAQRLQAPTVVNDITVSYTGISKLLKQTRTYNPDFLKKVGHVTKGVIEQLLKHNPSFYEVIILSGLVAAKMLTMSLVQSDVVSETVQAVDPHTEVAKTFYVDASLGERRGGNSNQEMEDSTKYDILTLYEGDDSRNDLVIGRINAANRGNEKILNITKKYDETGKIIAVVYTLEKDRP